MIVYGRNPVREAIRGPRTVSRVWATRSVLEAEWLAASGSQVAAASGEELERRAGSPDHQGICAEVSPFRYSDADDVLRDPGALLVVLDQVQDPQNLGAICRTAECVGATAVVIGERRSAEVTAAVCKASAGAVEHLPVVRVRNIADFLGDAKGASFWCYGAYAKAELGYREVDWRGRAAIVLGSEGRGLRPRVASACDALISIPLRGRTSSLSVGAAAAVLLYGALAARE